MARFALPEGSTVAIGEDPPAQWTFNPTRRILTNANRWAQVLSELEPLDGPLPARRLSAVADRVFDFEAEKDAEQETGKGGPPAGSDPDGLLDVLRSRRGQRLGVDEEGDDALAELLTRGSIPAAHPRNEADDLDSGDGAPDRTAAESVPPGLGLAPALPSDDDSATHHGDGSPRLYDGSTETREISIFARPAGSGQEGGSAGPSSTAPDSPRDEAPPSKDLQTQKNQGRTAGKTDEPADRRNKPKRSSVPSWDQIVFGTKGD